MYWPAYEEFKILPEHEQLMDNLRVDAAHTEIIIFTNKMFGRGFTPNTEILTAYWPTSLSLETQEEVRKAKTLVHIQKTRSLDGSMSCRPGMKRRYWQVWCHHWKSKELDDSFESTEERVVFVGRDTVYPLAVDDFQ